MTKHYWSYLLCLQKISHTTVKYKLSKMFDDNAPFLVREISPSVILEYHTSFYNC